MKKTSIIAILMLAFSFMSKAQSTITYYPPVVFDGMDSIFVHYNPYAAGGDHSDTIFQTYNGPLYAYAYLTDSVSGTGGIIGTYNNGSWTGVDIPVDSLRKITDSDYVWVIPNVRQFFSVPAGVYVTGVNIIFHNASGDTQSANAYIPVTHTFGSAGKAVTTGPLSSWPGGPFLADSEENVAVYYHPQYDTFTAVGDNVFKSYHGSIYVYSYVYTAPSGTTYQLTPWGSVGATPTDSLVKIDSNNYVWDLPNLRADFMAAGLPSGTAIDTLTVIFRTALGDTQTVNLYIPLVITSTPPPPPPPTIAITYYPPVVFDGMDSIFVHYNPYAVGGLHADTIFQTYTGPLYAYAYLNTSSGSYNNGSWTGVDIPVDSLRKVSDSDYVWVIPNLRQFFSVPSNVYVNGVNIIFHNTSGDTQSNNTYFPVTHSFGTADKAVTTGPLSSWPGGPFLADSEENVAVYYHPQYDTFTAVGDTVFKNYSGSIYVYSYIYTPPTGTTYQLTPWGSVGSTPTDSLVKIDSNDYVWDIPNLRADFMAAGLPSGTAIDTLTVIFRTASGDTQTANLYIPLVIDTPSTTGVANINTNNVRANVYPNPAIDGIIVAYSFPQEGSTTIDITNLVGQTVMTQQLGVKKSGNVYLSVDNLPSGIYLVTIRNGNSKIVERMTKQ